MKKGFSSLIVLLLIGLVLVVGLFVNYYKYYSRDIPLSITDNYAKDTYSLSPPRDGVYETYEFWNMEFKVPEDYSIIEKAVSVQIVSSNGEIILSRNGTNSTTLDEYFENHPHNLKDKMLEMRMININDLSAINGTLEDSRVWIFYAQNYVYNIETSDSELYDDLDQIAKSFKYTGDK